MRLKESDMAESMNLPASTINRWIRQGRIPVQKKGDYFVFERGVLDRWARTHKLSFTLPDENGGAQNCGELCLGNLLGPMRRGGVLFDIVGEDAESLFRESIERLAPLPDSLKPEILERLIQRERLASTGIGKGVAIPHPRNPTIKDLDHPLIATCFLEKAVDFGSVDNQPVFVLFLLLSPSAKHHLHLLSRISFCLRDNHFVEFLKNRPASDALFARISEIEATLEKKEAM